MVRAIHGDPSPALQIRLAVREDLSAIIQLLLRDSILDLPPQDHPSEEQINAFDTIAKHPDHEIIVATLQEEVVATAQLSFLPGLSPRGTWRAQVEAVRVREDLRSHRIGSRLMQWMIDRARDRGCWVVQLTSNRVRLDAHRFYERLGFTGSHLGMKLYL